MSIPVIPIKVFKSRQAAIVFSEPWSGINDGEEMIFKQEFYDSSVLVKVTFAEETIQKAHFTTT